MDAREASNLLRSLRKGDAVVMTQDGREHTLTVQREYMRADGAYGDPNGGQVTVGYGPGRWNTEVSVPRMVAGYVSLRRERATVDAALEAWESNGPTSLTAALMADALYGVREAVA